MGEARRRKSEIERLKRSEQDWLANLNPVERTVAEVAAQTHHRLVERQGLIGGCYLLAFFLNEFLYSRYSIETDLVVGWVNDGTWAGAASHAWIELKGKKTDISLTRTEFPESQLTGELLILDRVMQHGVAKYVYFRELPTEAREYMDKLVRNGDLPRDVAEEKDREHAYVSDLSKTREGIRIYLSRCPPDRSFEALLTAIKHKDLPDAGVYVCRTT